MPTVIQCSWKRRGTHPRCREQQMVLLLPCECSDIIRKGIDVSTLCLPDVTACDQMISHVFPFVLVYRKRSDTGGGNGLGMRQTVNHLNSKPAGHQTTSKKLRSTIIRYFISPRLLGTAVGNRMSIARGFS